MHSLWIWRISYVYSYMKFCFSSVVGVRYGKYCGIGYFGCPGEKPCDGLDACCMTHDNCVDLKGCFFCHNVLHDHRSYGTLLFTWSCNRSLLLIWFSSGMTYVNCHKQFQHCVNRLSRAIKQSNGTKVGFSTKCPYSKVIPTVYNGMDYGIFFSKIGKLLSSLCVYSCWACDYTIEMYVTVTNIRINLAQVTFLNLGCQERPPGWRLILLGVKRTQRMALEQKLPFREKKGLKLLRL